MSKNNLKKQISDREVEKYKKECRGREKKEEKEFREWVKMVEQQWRSKEWDEMKKKLAKLSLEELRDLATKTGIVFADGNEKVTNKEEFILVLDEADKDKLITEYEKIVKSRRKS